MKKAKIILELQAQNQALQEEVSALEEKIRTGKRPKTDNWKPIREELHKLFAENGIRSYPLVEKIRAILPPALDASLNSMTKDKFRIMSLAVAETIIQHNKIFKNQGG